MAIVHDFKSINRKLNRQDQKAEFEKNNPPESSQVGWPYGVAVPLTGLRAKLLDRVEFVEPDKWYLEGSAGVAMPLTVPGGVRVDAVAAVPSQSVTLTVSELPPHTHPIWVDVLDAKI